MKRFYYPEGGPTADLTIEALGSTLGEAFSNAALGMFNAMTPLEKVKALEYREVKASGDDIGSLLFNFLDEFLYIHEMELIVFSEIKAEVDEESVEVTAHCRGEQFQPGHHESGILVKAVTFHQMKIEQKGEKWRIRVVLDT